MQTEISNMVLEKIKALPPDMAKKALIEVFLEMKQIKPMDSFEEYYERFQSIFFKLRDLPDGKTRVSTPRPKIGGKTRKQRGG